MIKFDFSKTPGKKRTRFFSPSIEDALVTVITPYYNAGKYFEETFNCVMNQTFPWFEWIIVDDGTTNQDDLEILKKFEVKDNRIRVIHQKNGGLSCARNTGFANANTELIVPLDADDLIEPQYLEYLYWSMHYHPEAAWGYSDSYGFQSQEYVWKHRFSAEQMKKENMLVATAMIRKKDFEDIGGYKVEKWSYNEDWRFWLEMLAKHKKPVHVETELFWYRRADKSMLTSIVEEPEKVKFNEEIIRKASKEADGSVEAIEFPIKKSQFRFYKPQLLNWNRTNNPDKKGKRVLWLIPWMVMGGADKFNLDAIAGLTELGYENSILTTLPSENDWKQKFQEYTDEIFCMPDFLDPAHYVEFVAYFIQSRQIDVLMVTNSYDGYYMLPWIRHNFPELVIIDYVHMEEWYWRAGGHARTSSALCGITERTYVCNSATRDAMISRLGCQPDHVQCMYIGVDSDYFKKENEEPGYLHKKLNLEEERSVVLIPCRIHEQKRPFMVLDIAQKVKKQIPNVAFVVVGDGPQLEELKYEIQNKNLNNYIYCTGRSENMRACYRDSNVTLICSLKEGLALTAYESCAMSVPVISSDVGGQRDLVGEDVGALIPLQQSEENDLNKRDFPESEVEEYAKHIVEIISDAKLAKKLGDTARKKIEDIFSSKKMIENLDSELKFLTTDKAIVMEREECANVLRKMPGYAAEFYTMYNEWKRQEEECQEIWQARCWFQNQLDKIYTKPDGKIMKIYQNMIKVPGIGKIVEKAAHMVVQVAHRFKN